MSKPEDDYLEENKQYICNTNQEKELKQANERIAELENSIYYFKTELGYLNEYSTKAGNDWLSNEIVNLRDSLPVTNTNKIKADAIREAVVNAQKEWVITRGNFSDCILTIANRLDKSVK